MVSAQQVLNVMNVSFNFRLLQYLYYITLIQGAANIDSIQDYIESKEQIKYSEDLLKKRLDILKDIGFVEYNKKEEGYLITREGVDFGQFFNRYRE